MTTLSTTDTSESVLFVGRAISEDATRYFMDGIECESATANTRNLVATDGRRLHVAYGVETTMEIGGYKLAKRAKANSKSVEYSPKVKGDYQFPNWLRVIPTEFSDAEPVVIDLSHTRKKDSGKYSLAVCDIVRALPVDRYINFDFVDDLQGFCWTMKVDKKSGAAVFTTEAEKIGVPGYLAVIALMNEPDVKAKARLQPTPEPVAEPTEAITEPTSVQRRRKPFSSKVVAS